jgi:hypothetical protein
MKLKALITPTFQAALGKLTAQELPLRTSFYLKGVLKKNVEESKKYEDVRLEALSRVADKNEDGSMKVDANNQVHLSPDNLIKFQTELNALLETEVELGSVKLPELGEKTSLSPNDLLALEGFVVE